MAPVEPLVDERRATPVPASALDAIGELRKRSAKDRILAVQEKRIVAYPAFATALNHVFWMVKGLRSTRAPGLILTGPPGSGKTSFGEVVVREFPKPPPTASTAASAPCVLMISMTGLTTIRSVYGRILEATNAPVTSAQRVADREIVVVRTLERIGCGLLVLDEIQDILKGRDRERQQVLDATKYLMNRLGLPVLALGVQEAAQAFDADPHLRARFQHMQFRHWLWNKEFLSLLAGIENFLPLRERSDIQSEPIAKKLLELSGGCLSTLMLIIRNAAIEAIATGSERITFDQIRPLHQVPSHQYLDGMHVGDTYAS